MTEGSVLQEALSSTSSTTITNNLNTVTLDTPTNVTNTVTNVTQQLTDTNVTAPLASNSNILNNNVTTEESNSTAEVTTEEVTSSVTSNVTSVTPNVVSEVTPKPKIDETIFDDNTDLTDISGDGHVTNTTSDTDAIVLQKKILEVAELFDNLSCNLFFAFA